MLSGYRRWGLQNFTHRSDTFRFVFSHSTNKIFSTTSNHKRSPRFRVTYFSSSSTENDSLSGLITSQQKFKTSHDFYFLCSLVLKSFKNIIIPKNLTFLCITYLQKNCHTQANMKYYKNDGDKPKSPHFFSAKKIISTQKHLRRLQFFSSQIIQKYYYSEKLDVLMYNVPTEKLPCPS